MFKNLVIKVSLVFIIFSYMIDPTGEFFHLKYISTGIACVLFFIFGLSNLNKLQICKLQFIYLLFFCIIMPIYGSVITFLYSNLTLYLDSSYIGFSLFLLLLSPIAILEKEHFFKALLISLRVLTAIIILVLISFIYDGDQFGISQFFIEHKSMFVGFREYAGITTYYLYFTASPLLLILLTYDTSNLINKKSINSFFSFIITTTALFLTGTRFNMLIAIIILPITLSIKNFKLKHVLTYSLIILIMIVLIFQNSFTSSFFDAKEVSNSVKTGYFEDYSIILSKPSTLLFGQGFNAQDWSYTFKNMLLKSSNEGTKTELTYFELIRVFGILIGSLIIVLITLIPFFIYREYKQMNFKFLATTIYLISSALNPYIFSTNGVLFFMFFLSEFKNETSVFKDFKLVNAYV